MIRFGKSNIYNTIELIKSTSEIGVSLFRKTYTNNYFFKTLIAGRNIIISENDNFITINAGSIDNNYHRFIISGKTQINTDIINFTSESPILLTMKGKIDDAHINISSLNEDFLGIYTYDAKMDIRYHNNLLSIIHRSNDFLFDLFFEITSQSTITISSTYNINSII